MSFGFTRSTRPQQQQSTSIGETQQSSSSTSNSRGFSRAVQRPDIVSRDQAPFLRDLYQRGQTNVDAQAPQANQAFEGAIGTLSDLASPGISPYLGAYQNQVQQNLVRNLLPSIQSEAINAGQLGGGRQGVAQGLAVSDANQQISDMAAQLYNADQDRRLNAVNALPGALGIPWLGLQNYAGLLGGPTVLGQGGFSESRNTSSSRSSSSGFGTQSSQSTGSGGGGGGGFNVGLFGPG